MAYDLTDFYNNTLSVNSLSKSIIDQMMSENRFSNVSKISLTTNYSSGNANSEPIGYTETGRPIYDQNIGLTMTDDVKDALANTHARNTDTMLRGIGTNVIENTSTGNIVAFASKGVYKAFITEEGRFTGKIRLENIEDLANITLDTSRFYVKTQVDALLDSKVSKASLFNETGKIPTTFLDADVITKNVFEPHNVDADRHITKAERNTWNTKYLKPLGGIPMADLSVAVSDKINASATKAVLDEHLINVTEHTSVAERTKFNAKYDKPVTGIPMSDLAESLQTNITSSAKAVDLTAHKDNTIAHLTAEERAKWNVKYDKPEAGIPATHLDTATQKVLNDGATKGELSTHVANDVAHVTNAERTKWNGQFTKPVTGILETDLNASVQSKLNNASTKGELSMHSSDKTVHIASEERTAWNNHASDKVIHLTAEERTLWSGKYKLPVTGVPESDLSSTVTNKLNGAVTSTDFNDHATDSTKHVTLSERSLWTNKYDKPSTGVPLADLSGNVNDLLTNASTKAELATHSNDATKHVTASEKAIWSAKYDKIAGGIPESDLASALKTKLASFALNSALQTHVTNVIAHVTAEERTTWNAKYNKPLTGIPESDLAESLITKIGGMVTGTDFNDHATDSTKHVTSSERNAWNSKFDKPSNGIALTDMTQVFQDKVNASVSVTAFNGHTQDTVSHVTINDRNDWDAKYDLPETGLPLTDMETGLQTKVNNATDHVADTAKHVTSADKVNWESKYLKPTNGIPEADLVPTVVTKLANSVSHIANADIHVTAVNKADWDGKYTKPAGGVPENDLETALATKLSAISAPYFKTVSVDATTVTSLATEHNVDHANGFEFTVTAFAQNGDEWETVVPSLVKVNQLTKTVEVQFTSAFTGTIVIR